MSAKRMAASTPSARWAERVTSAARAGVLQSSMNVTLPRTAMYSGRYRPACRMIHTGVVSVFSRRQALRKRESWRAGERDIKIDFGFGISDFRRETATILD